MLTPLEIEQFKENPDSYSTVVFKGKPENESDDQDNDQDNENQYSTVVLKGFFVIISSHY